MSPERRSALLVLAIGGTLALLAQLAAPVAVPLYDGVVVQDPYRFLTPASGQAGSPTSYTSEPGVDTGGSRAFVAATTENPPQAQLIALGGVFTIPSGVTTLKVSIEPVAPQSAPAAGSIAGNVYRLAVTDGSGAALAIAAGSQVTLTLRAPDGVTDASIGRLTATGWELLPTDHGGGFALFSTNPTELGDFALMAGAGSGGLPIVPLALLGIALAAIVAGVVAVLVMRGRRARRAREAADAAAARARIPSRRASRQRPPPAKRRRP